MSKTPKDLSIRVSNCLTIKDQPLEIVERKGKGHPDSICDALVEEASLALNRVYREYTGRILHYNLDKGLLAAGRVETAFGGGKVLVPMKMIMGDRTSFQYLGKKLPIWDTIVEAAQKWIDRNLRYVALPLVFQNELRPGSTELTNIFKQGGKIASANDTSAVVGFAPRTSTEELVLWLEHYLNSYQFQQKFPAAGEDVKIMAVRQEQSLNLTIAMAFVDRFIANEKDYFAQKKAIMEELENFVRSRSEFSPLTIHLNALDQRGKGVDGLYLTVTGTSAEQGDSGQVGRGNQVNGLICLMRPQSSEAAAGKNPISHVGKIYNHLAYTLAEDLYNHLGKTSEVYVWLTSRIGEPVNQPTLVAVELVPYKGKKPATGYKGIVSSVVQRHLQELPGNDL